MASPTPAEILGLAGPRGGSRTPTPAEILGLASPPPGGSAGSVQGGVSAKKGGGILGKIAKYSGAQLVGNLGKDVGAYAVGVGPGFVKLGAAVAADVRTEFEHPLRTGGALNPVGGRDKSETYKQVVKPMVQQYKDYYGHDVLHHLYAHPLQPVLDAVTVLSGGAGAIAKGGKIAASAGVISDANKVARFGDRATLVTRSPKLIATGEGPAHTDITSAVPIVKLREQAAAKIRQAKPGSTLGRIRPGGVLGVGGEVKTFGKQIQASATQHALGNLAHYEPYYKATRKLSQDEWTALHIRAMDIHPDDLTELWRGTPAAEVAANPKIRTLVQSPSKRMVAAEPAARALADEGATLFKQVGRLQDETAAMRPDLTKVQASQVLERPVKTITGNPYYFPHTFEPHRATDPFTMTGGGKGVPRLPGTAKQNKGILALTGKIHLRSDVLGPEFLRRVKYVKYDEVHNALIRGAVPVTRRMLDENLGGKLPKGWEYVREKATTKVPFTMRAEGTAHTPIHELIPDPEDLHGSPLSEGFSTADINQAHVTGKKESVYHIVPKATVKAATGEFTKSPDFTRNFVRRPLSVWRAAVLGLRVGFLTNNLIGNSVMYGVKVGGKGALRDLFRAIVETHGRDAGLKILNNAATPAALRADLYKEFFPEQVRGTFGLTQSPSTTLAQTAGRKTGAVWRGATGALPKLTSKVAEEYPRRALVRNAIRRSPEYKRVYAGLPAQTRTFEQAARQVLEGTGGKQYQRFVSRQVNRALGDYLNMSSVERNVLRNTAPFYSWYKAITTTTFHLAADTPLRANILGQLGQIGKQWSDDHLGAVPSFLEGSVGLGHGKGGTVRVLGTQSLNPYATLDQLRRGTQDVGSLGLNPFVMTGLQVYAGAQNGKIAPAKLVWGTAANVVKSLPPARLILKPKPSNLYPNKSRKSEGLGYLGVPIKEYNPVVAAQQAKQGR